MAIGTQTRNAVALIGNYCVDGVTLLSGNSDPLYPLERVFDPRPNYFGRVQSNGSSYDLDFSLSLTLFDGSHDFIDIECVAVAGLFDLVEHNSIGGQRPIRVDLLAATTATFADAITLRQVFDVNMTWPNMFFDVTNGSPSQRNRRYWRIRFDPSNNPSAVGSIQIGAVYIGKKYEFPNGLSPGGTTRIEMENQIIGSVPGSVFGARTFLEHERFTSEFNLLTDADRDDLVRKAHGFDSAVGPVRPLWTQGLTGILPFVPSEDWTEDQFSSAWGMARVGMFTEMSIASLKRGAYRGSLEFREIPLEVY